MIAVKLKVPANNTTIIIAVLKINSYDTIAAVLLKDPKKLYLEAPAQPANSTPYIPKEDRANVYNKPKEKSNKTNPSPKGITPQPNKANINVAQGARKNKVLLALAGITVSLTTNFKASAKGCNTPYTPTTLGPTRL